MGSDCRPIYHLGKLENRFENGPIESNVALDLANGSRLNNLVMIWRLAHLYALVHAARSPHARKSGVAILVESRFHISTLERWLECVSWHRAQALTTEASSANKRLASATTSRCVSDTNDYRRILVQRITTLTDTGGALKRLNMVIVDGSESDKISFVFCVLCIQYVIATLYI